MPSNISAEAQAFYEQDVMAIPDFDFTSVSSVQPLRDMVGVLWGGLCEQIPYDYHFESISINGINCYQIDPPEISNTDLVILYVHGGSHIFGHPTLCKNIPVSIAQHSGIRVISVEYRLGPEHPFPAAINDLLEVIQGLKSHFGEAVRYGITGHSSGGGLALSTTLKAKQNGLPSPAALALLAPWVEVELSGDSMLTLKEFDANPPSQEWFYNSVQAFIGEHQRNDPLLSPLYGDFEDLCPTYIQQPGRDRLLSDATRLNRRLIDANISSTLDIWDGMWHGFQMFPLLPEAQQANKVTATFLKKHLEKV